MKVLCTNLLKVQLEKHSLRVVEQWSTYNWTINLFGCEGYLLQDQISIIIKICININVYCIYKDKVGNLLTLIQTSSEPHTTCASTGGSFSGILSLWNSTTARREFLNNSNNMWYKWDGTYTTWIGEPGLRPNDNNILALVKRV